MSMDFISLQGIKGMKQFCPILLYWAVSYLSLFLLLCQGLSQRSELSSEVGVVGQRVTNSNGTIKTEETTGPSPPLDKPAFHESVRGLRSARGQPAVAMDSPENNIFCA